MNELIKQILVFVGIGLCVIVLFSLTPLDDWNQGWFAGIITVAIFNSIYLHA